jgi:fructoselysine 6-kinase
MSLVAVGDNVTDLYVDRGLMFPGGNSVNVAVHAARAGTRAAYVGVVGDDERGRLLLTALAAEGVDPTGVVTRPGRTASAVVHHVDGERVFGSNDKGVSLFSPSPGQLAHVARFRLAHSSYCSGMEEHLGRLATATAVSFDFNDRTDDGYADALLPHVRVATFSAAHLARRDCEDLVRWAHARGAARAFATRGSDGATAFDGEQVHHAPAVPVEATDSLGAGDAFIGRALHGVLAGEPTAVLLAAAVRAGSDACRWLGGFGHGRAPPEAVEAHAGPHR